MAIIGRPSVIMGPLCANSGIKELIKFTSNLTLSSIWLLDTCKFISSVWCLEPGQKPLLSNEIHNTFIYITVNRIVYKLMLYSFSASFQWWLSMQKALYKLKVVIAKGSNITFLELPGCCRANTVGDMFAANSFKWYFSESRKCRYPVFSCITLP